MMQAYTHPSHLNLGASHAAETYEYGAVATGSGYLTPTPLPSQAATGAPKPHNYSLINQGEVVLWTVVCVGGCVLYA